MCKKEKSNDVDKGYLRLATIIALIIWVMTFLFLFFLYIDGVYKMNIEYVLTSKDSLGVCVIGTCERSDYAVNAKDVIEAMTDTVVDISIVFKLSNNIPVCKGVKLYNFKINIHGEYIIELALADRYLLQHIKDANSGYWKHEDHITTSYQWGFCKDDVVKRIPCLYKKFFPALESLPEFVNITGDKLNG